MLKEYESMKAGLKALQNTSFSTFRGSEDGNPSPRGVNRETEEVAS